MITKHGRRAVRRSPPHPRPLQFLTWPRVRHQSPLRLPGLERDQLRLEKSGLTLFPCGWPSLCSRAGKASTSPLALLRLL